MAAERKKCSTRATQDFQTRLEDLIAEKKKKSGKSQNQIADEIGITASALSNYASDSKEAGINSLCKIARYFGVSTDYLLGLNDNPSTNPTRRAITTEYGLSDKTLRIFKKQKKKKNAYGEFVIEFFNLLIETVELLTNQTNPPSCHMPDLPIHGINYIAGVHEYLLWIDCGGKSIEISGYRSNVQEDDAEFKIYQLTRDFEYWIKYLAKDIKVRKRLKIIFDKYDIEPPIYGIFKEQRFDEKKSNADVGTHTVINKVFLDIITDKG